jgi:hypothetical protein
MFNEICTIYNKYFDTSGVEKWQRTILNGVFWDSVKGANYRKTGLENVDEVMLIIPKNIKSGKIYKKPKEWAALQSKSGYFTIFVGDSIIKGNTGYDIVKSSKELERFDDCYKVTKIDYKGFGSDLDHWEVGGR